MFKILMSPRVVCDDEYNSHIGGLTSHCYKLYQHMAQFRRRLCVNVLVGGGVYVIQHER